MTIIELSQGKVAVIDDADFPLVSTRKWYALEAKKRGIWYAASTDVDRVLMHRLLLGVNDTQLVDHRDHDGLNNRRSNLRPCSVRQNAMNSRPRGRFKGVVRLPYGNRFAGKIVHNGKPLHLGVFGSEVMAAAAYNAAASKLFGEFAFLNDLGAANDGR